MYDKMMDDVARRFGFEDPRTINFFELCEAVGSSGEAWMVVREDYEAWMAEPIFSEE